jgi:hypothetical protein
MSIARRLGAGLMSGVLLASAAGLLAAGREDSSPDPPGVTGEMVFHGLVEHSKVRDADLQKYSVRRTYELSNAKGHVYARETVEMKFDSPGTKSFQSKSGDGSWLVRKLVFRGLMDSEIETAGGEAHRQSAIAPANYTFQLLGEQQVGPYRCYVVKAVPKREGKYLFIGKLWINMPDYGIVEIAGSPDRKPSFWIKKANFVRMYEKVGEFWLPESDRTVVSVKLIGQRIFSIRHWDYEVNGPSPAAEISKSSAPDPR